MDGQYGDSTRTVKATASQRIPGQPVAPPPVPASAYHLSSDESRPLDTYGRASNPVWRQLESALAELEGATSALAFGSGMAAITSALRVLARPGTTLVVPADGYYQVRRYALEYLAPQGITVIEATAEQMCDAAVERRRGARRDAGEPDARRRRPAPAGADLPGPQCDPRRRQHHCRRRLAQQPLSLGADLVVASATKALSGHSDLVAGYVAGSHAELMAAVERERLLAGAILGPFEAWLALRSLGSAGLRFERQCHNALAMALMLRGHPAVRSVRYPGLPDDPAHEVACRR